MIAKAKSISHGINDISYITGESRNKKHPERIFHVKDNLLPPGLDATGIWDSMRLTLDKFKKVKNSVIRIEVSPAPEHTKDFTITDWEKLWNEFMDEFDYRETANSRELTDRAVALFVGMMSAQAAPSGGGGGSSSDLPWGRREDEDDREWARRCAREAERMIGRKPKTGRKR